MADKRCAKCGEMVDEAKAFCPGCGHSFEDEKQRTTVSEFDQSKRTVQLGETMFNQMLSEMGLSISKHPGGDEKKVEVVAPLTPSTPPAAAKQEAQPLPEPANKRTTNIIKIAVIVIAVFSLGILVMIAAAAALYFYYK